MFDQIASNRRRSYLLIVLFVLLIAGIGYAFGLLTELGYYAVIPAAAIAIAVSWSSYYYSDRIVLSMSKARPASRQQEPYLWNTVEGLSIAAGLPMPRVYIIEDSAPNAFATGRDPQHAAVAVTRGLLDKLNRLELEGVVAHEMSHIGNYDIRLMTLVTVLVGTVVLLSDWMARSLRYGRRRSSGKGGAGGIVVLVALVFLILSPVIARLIRFAISRQREFLADASGALMTRYPEGLASALEKLVADTDPLEVANKATAHLYIINPLTEHKGWTNTLFSTHPPLAERVARLRAM